MKDGKITSNQRIVAALDTVKHVLGKNAKSVVRFLKYYITSFSVLLSTADNKSFHPEKSIAIQND